MTLRQLNRRCGPLSEATTAQIQALPVESWKPWRTPCSTSRARPIWRPGWRETLEAAHLICSCAGVCTAVQILKEAPKLAWRLASP